jgi:hypothetical protein
MISDLDASATSFAADAAEARISGITLDATGRR